jgi:hypothetical protein
LLYFKTIILLLCLAFNHPTSAQTQPYAGEYRASHGTNDSGVLIEYTLNFSKTKALYISKSPRNLSEQFIKTS